MKTILINIFDSAVAKNIFMPGFNRVLSDAAGTARVVVTVPEHKVAEMIGQYGATGVTFVARKQRYATAYENMAMFIARNAIPSHTVRQIQEEGIDGSGKLPLAKYIVARLAWLLGHTYAFRRLIKLVCANTFRDAVFDDVLEQYKPDLVFASTLYAVDDMRLLKAAKRRGIRTIGMVKSWDSLTSKDAILIPPDSLIVNNEVVRAEAVTIHGYPDDRIAVIGVPQFDWYADSNLIESREDFFRRLGLDPTKKLITYTAMGLWLVKHERDVIGLLARIVGDGTLSEPAQLLVRLHPAYPDEKTALKHAYPHIHIDEPGSPVVDPQNPWKADWKFGEADIRHLASTLRRSDVTLNSGSTMILDAACLDTPIIGVAFDGGVMEPSYWRSARRLFHREHCKNVLSTGGVRLVNNESELIAALNGYLGDRSLDTDGRARLVRQQAGTIGRASQRLAEALLNELNHV